MSLLRHAHRSGPVIEEIDWVDPEAAFMPFAAQIGALWLDSSDTTHPAGRHSFIAHSPYKTIAVQDWQAHEGFGALDAQLRAQTHLWDGLAAHIHADLPPFRGGAAGLWGYDLAYGLETLPPNKAPFAVDELHIPAMLVGLYATVLAFDHIKNRAFIIATGLPADTPAARRDAAHQAIAQMKHHLTGIAPAPLPAPAKAPPLAAPPDSNFSPDAYRHAVANTIEAIFNGDIFQANLAQCFTAQLNAQDSAFAYYRRLRRESPAPFAAFACFDGFALASASPERFLHADNGKVETRPIKGTEARGDTPRKDAQNAQRLLASAKNRAENIMIVDLLRNDLAKACAARSIKVPELCRLESFSDAHHLVSTVRGQLADTKTPLDALKAGFPGGSITGAPKIRAMEFIAAGETCRRGPSYGSLGYIGFDGRMDTSIIIRTAIVKAHRLRFHVGGAIVADSQPAAEYIETLTKARGLMAALGVDVHAFMASHVA